MKEIITVNDLEELATEMEDAWGIQNLMHDWTVNEKSRDTTELSEMSKKQIANVVDMLETMKNDISHFQAMLKLYAETLEH